jgi:hypothetical protein
MKNEFRKRESPPSVADVQHLTGDDDGDDPVRIVPTSTGDI